MSAPSEVTSSLIERLRGDLTGLKMPRALEALENEGDHLTFLSAASR